MKKLITIFLYSVFLMSCATAYQSKGFGGGYEDLKLANDTYMVSFRGNGFTGQDKAFQYALRRCAELTKENGYNYFAILDSSSSTRTSQYRTPVQAQTNSSYTGYAYDDYGYVNGNSTTTYTGGDVHVIEKPLVTITIKMYTDAQPNTLDANAILSNFNK